MAQIKLNQVYINYDDSDSRLYNCVKYYFMRLSTEEMQTYIDQAYAKGSCDFEDSSRESFRLTYNVSTKEYDLAMQ
jgi:hypothetical protein